MLRRLVPLTLVCTVLFAAFCSSPSWALDTIYSPNIEAGEVALEYNGSRTFDPANVGQHCIGLRHLGER